MSRDGNGLFGQRLCGFTSLTLDDRATDNFKQDKEEAFAQNGYA
jgi:hypothetical protein